MAAAKKFMFATDFSGNGRKAVDEAAIEEARRRVDERRFEARNRREESAGSGGAVN